MSTDASVVSLLLPPINYTALRRARLRDVAGELSTY